MWAQLPGGLLFHTMFHAKHLRKLSNVTWTEEALCKNAQSGAQ